jgi:hypothetical protein
MSWLRTITEPVLIVRPPRVPDRQPAYGPAAQQFPRDAAGVRGPSWSETNESTAVCAAMPYPGGASTIAEMCGRIPVMVGLSRRQGESAGVHAIAPPGAWATQAL